MSLNGLATKMLGQQVDVHIIQRRNLITLGQLRLERLQIGQIGNRLDGGAVAERLATRPHARGLIPIEIRTQCPQVVGQLRHFGGKIGVGEYVAHAVGRAARAAPG